EGLPVSRPIFEARLSRRSLFAAAGLTLGAAAVAEPGTPAGAVAAGPKGFPPDLRRAFHKPGTKTAAGFRWWWPHGLVDPREISHEVDQVAAAGFGVLEIADVTHSLRARNIEID